jgi:hypothetical protein
VVEWRLHKLMTKKKLKQLLPRLLQKHNYYR